MHLTGRFQMNRLPGGKLGSRHRDHPFSVRDIRFTVCKDGSLYAFTMQIPQEGQTVLIKSLGTAAGYLDSDIRKVELLGYKGRLSWQQSEQGLEITYPADARLKTSAVFRIR